jgi:hypothetical protein
VGVVANAPLVALLSVGLLSCHAAITGKRPRSCAASFTR